MKRTLFFALSVFIFLANINYSTACLCDNETSVEFSDASYSFFGLENIADLFKSDENDEEENVDNASNDEFQDTNLNG